MEARVSNFKISGATRLDIGPVAILSQAEETFFNAHIESLAMALRKRELHKYRLLLQPIHHVAQMEGVRDMCCELLQPGTAVIQRFQEKPEAAVWHYQSLLATLPEITSMDDIKTWMTADFNRELCFFPCSKIVVILQCSISQFFHMMSGIFPFLSYLFQKFIAITHHSVVLMP